MTPEYQEFLNILSLSLHGEGDSIDSQKDWDYIYKEGKAHAIIPLLVGSIPNADWGDNLNSALSIYAGNTQTFYELLDEQDKLDKILSSKDIKYAVIKGTSAAMYYPNPELRSMGDIDLLIEKFRFPEIQKLLEDQGYTLVEGLNESHRHIELQSPDGVIVEPHIKFSYSNNKAQNDYLDDLLGETINNITAQEFLGHQMYFLPELENGIVLISHINQHIGDGLGLRQIIDWMYYVERIVTDDFWNQQLAPQLNNLGFTKLAITVTAMCSKYLGLQSDASWYKSMLNDEVVDELTEYVMNHGNFGRKDFEGNQSIEVIRLFKENPFKGLVYAQKRGEVTWVRLRKHKWLKPFAWIYQIGRWISKGTKGGVQLSDMSNLNTKEEQKRLFLEKLEATRISRM